MKKIFNYCIVILLPTCLCGACKNTTLDYDKELVIIFDQSDPLRVNPDANEISSQLGLKQDIWQGIRIGFTYISDKDVNAEKVITIEKGDRFIGNTQLRTAQVVHFKKELRTAMVGTGTERSLEHSIIYRTVAKQLNVLSSSKATNRYLLLYSDLMENDEISFYNSITVTLLRTHPAVIQQQLVKGVSLHNLSGIQVWLLYDPASFEENNIYIAIANMYKQLLESKGAIVHIEKTLNL